MSAGIEAARSAYDRRAWDEAYEALRTVDAASGLDPADLVRLASAARWTRRMAESLWVLERAVGAFESAGDQRAAAGVAIEITKQYWERGDDTLAGAWFGRAAQLVDSIGDCPESARFRLSTAYLVLRGGDEQQALVQARASLEDARRLGDRSLEAMALLYVGHALIAGGDVKEGVALAEQASALALGDTLDLDTTGLVFCSTIFACRNGGDWRRAGEWADASLRYCERNDLGWFPGLCRFHRAEVLRMRGDLDAAREAAQVAVDELLEWAPRHAPLGFSELGEIARRRGDRKAAEESFARCAELGGQPGPGRALMLAAAGDTQGALAALRQGLAGDVLLREPAAVLPACVAVAIVAGDEVFAADSLERLRALPGPSAAAAAVTAEGHLALRAGRADEAVSALRRGVAAYFEMHAPFEAARARMLLGHALLACGDAAGAELEQEAARATLERLGASLELEPAVVDPGSAGGRALVTFMFTDIVGSTRLLDELGDEGWSDLLTRHDAIVRAGFVPHGGREIKHEGDGFFVAFQTSGAAVTAGCAIQSALARARESDDSIPPVRVAIHSARATARGADFIGRGVHQAARLAAAAEGGEVLVSVATLATAGEQFTAVDARDLVLRGFADPLAVASVRWSL
jgi:class 3 adenylate cyclase